LSVLHPLRKTRLWTGPSQETTSGIKHRRTNVDFKYSCDLESMLNDLESMLNFQKSMNTLLCQLTSLTDQTFFFKNFQPKVRNDYAAPPGWNG